MYVTNMLHLAALAVLLTATLITAHPFSYLTVRSTLTAAGLQNIAPTSNTCTGATHPDECRTAEQALTPILHSFETYKITDPATQAAVLSTIALESGDFKFARHYFPSPNPGQGTRNMQSASLNLKYAQSIPELKDKLAAAPQGGDALVDLLIEYSDYDFGSAAWFLTTQCDKGVVNGLKTPGQAGFKAYLDCIGSEMSDQRTGYYNRALAALGGQNS